MIITGIRRRINATANNYGKRISQFNTQKRVFPMNRPVVVLSIIVLVALSACTRYGQPASKEPATEQAPPTQSPSTPAPQETSQTTPATQSLEQRPEQESEQKLTETQPAQQTQQMNQTTPPPAQPQEALTKSSKFKPATEPLVKEVKTEEVKKFDIVVKQWEFIPDTITVNVGDKVEFKLINHDVPHGFYLPAFGVSEYLGRGENATAKFTADKGGQFGFSCNVYCGAGHGNMVGKLVVNP
ncbi:cupredoxin domain-containing protein [Candidatus Woesearchaeota archaeon]|nr:cupredoxin domain-containing protein [Candidatus Woesearchaeota archaeon]